ncbi:MAG TPA: outer membrane beta-barrel protein, partial [Syntrophales bacterium]|nr:outer membrane beta-barrel protein [Syntrophales bacterium]
MNRTFSCVLVLVLSGILFFSSAPATMAAEAGPFYVGVFGGWVMPKDLEPEDGDDIALKDSWALGAKVGYIIPQVRWLAVELDYAYLAKQDVDEPGADGDFKASNLMVNLIFRYPEGKIRPYIGGGLGWSWGSFKASS